MDPDATLDLALTSPDPDERNRAALDLRGWLARGGFPPHERTLRQAGVDRRMRLAERTYLEKYRDGWAIVLSGTMNVYYRLLRD